MVSKVPKHTCTKEVSPVKPAWVYGDHYISRRFGQWDLHGRYTCWLFVLVGHILGYSWYGPLQGFSLFCFLLCRAYESVVTRIFFAALLNKGTMFAVSQRYDTKFCWNSIANTVWQHIQHLMISIARSCICIMPYVYLVSSMLRQHMCYLLACDPLCPFPDIRCLSSIVKT